MYKFYDIEDNLWNVYRCYSRHVTYLAQRQCRSKVGGAMGAVRPGRRFLGGGKIEVMLYLKTKNREDQKKVVKKIWEG